MSKKLIKLMEEFVQEEKIKSIEELDIALKKIYYKVIKHKKVSEKDNNNFEKNKYDFLIKTWQNKQLESIYPFIYFYKKEYILNENKNKYQTFCIVKGITLKGKKEILGIYFKKKKTPEFVADIIFDLKKRGIQDLLIAFIGKLTCISNALEVNFPEIEVQKYNFYNKKEIIKKIKKKDKKQVLEHLNIIFGVENKEFREFALKSFSDEFEKIYPLTINSVKEVLEYLDLLSNYSKEIREIIIDLNLIKSLDDKIEKMKLSNKKIGNTVLLLEQVYTVIYNSEKQWRKKTLRNWRYILNELKNRYDGRILNF